MRLVSQFPKRNKNGFTIVELLIVILVMGILMSIGTASYRDFARGQAVVSAKRQIMADLRSAQSDALHGRKPAACTGTLEGYSFEFNTSAPWGYSVSVLCPASANAVLLKTHTFESNVTVTAPSPNPIVFSPVNQGNNVTGTATIGISMASGQTETVVITASGEIR